MNPKSVIIFLMGVVSVIWMLNPPGLNLDDTIPGIGNLDEAAAMLILLNCLAYFGWDLTRFFKAGGKNPADPPAPVVEVDAEVVNRTK